MTTQLNTNSGLCITTELFAPAGCFRCLNVRLYLMDLLDDFMAESIDICEQTCKDPGLSNFIQTVQLREETST